MRDPRAIMYTGYVRPWVNGWWQHSWNVRDGEILDGVDDAAVYFGVPISDPAEFALEEIFAKPVERFEADLGPKGVERLCQLIDETEVEL